MSVTEFDSQTVEEVRTKYDQNGLRQLSEIGSVPASWLVKPVGAMGEVRAGKALAANGPGELRPYLRTMNVFDGRIDVSDTLSMPMTESEFSLYKLEKNDVLLNEGQSIELVGRCSIYQGEFGSPCAIQNALIRFRAFAKTSPSFATHLFRYCQKIGVFSKVALQTTSVAHLGVSRFANLNLPWPESAEQEAIAEALGDADALIESLEQLLAKKRNLKQAAMQQLLTGKKRLPGFEGEWESLPIGKLYSIGGGLSASRDDLSNSGVCYLHYGDIHGRSKTYIDAEREQNDIPRIDVDFGHISSCARLEHGDVVFVDASEDVEGTSKHVVIYNETAIPFISGLHTIVAKPTSDRLAPSYAQFCFQTEVVKNQFRFFAVGTKVFGVSKSNIARIEILVPGISEQFAIGKVLADMDFEIEVIEAKLSKARMIKMGMMQELLTGKRRLV